MSAVLKVQQALETITCCNCGVVFAVPEYFRTKRLEDHGWFYCPSGHSQHFTGETEAERLQKELDKERSRIEFLKREAASAKAAMARAKNQLAETKKTLTKTRTRIRNAVCPCCNRSFVNSRLAQHIASKHPEYANEKKEVAEECKAAQRLP